METGKQHLIKFKRRWQLLACLEVLLYAIGIGMFTYLIVNQIFFGLLFFTLALILLILLKRPWSHNLSTTSSYIDAHLAEASFSTGLLLQQEESLSSLAKLQRYKVSQELKTRLSSMTPPNKVKQATIVLCVVLACGFLINRLGLFNGLNEVLSTNPKTEQIQFVAIDSLSKVVVQPKITNQVIKIFNPKYTRLGTQTVNDPNIKAVVNSGIEWRLQFDNPVSNVFMERMGESIPLRKVNEGYTLRHALTESGFYSFKFSNEDGVEFVSDLFSMEAIPDKAPEIEIVGLEQYTYFEASDSKKIQLQSAVSDDFGIAAAYIIATVSKGAGESVKFREEKLNFNTSIQKGERSMNLNKSIDLDALKMELGDELYFYIEAYDQRTPKPNIARSETYFAVIKDTVTDQFGVEGTLGVDQMPDYFRSQRQLIIDTEKLIKDKPSITTQEFNSRSNELGYDQKALRLKYGQFMGDESEMQEAPHDIETDEVGDDHNHAEDEEDILEEYSHKHDTENEHNLVPAGDSEEVEDPLHDYLHNHDDPEESTLFEESLKTKLRKALSIMWDAELYLRLYQPEKSLPFQYDALKLIQEIKNSARIYVHRIGFDPPPIKEESRLTGEIEDINNFQKTEQQQVNQPFESIQKAVAQLEKFIHQQAYFQDRDTSIFTNAGNELAVMAIKEPGKYLSTLQGLKRIENNTGRTIENYSRVQKGLLSALPKTRQIPGAREEFADAINSLFLKQLETYD